MMNLDPKIISVLISAGTTLVIFILSSIGKSFWDKYFHNYKLKADHKYEQRKKIKEAISKYKVRLMDSSESLNHRLWNFSDNIAKGWHKKVDEKNISEQYYLESFSYRFLSFFAWCRKIEKEMFYLDSTISDPEDLEFIKYLKTFPQLFSDTSLFSGNQYDSFHDKDHFFKDDFLSMIDKLITNDDVMSYSTFKEKSSHPEYKKIITYIDDISINKTCLKWHALNSFHFILMAFLSKFGYDFQKTSSSKLKSFSKKNPQNILAENLITILKRNHLEKTKEIKLSIEAINVKANQNI
jgi:hypothetical protein